MSSLNQPTAWDGTGHPPLELLRQYHEEMLPDGLRHRLERHLLDCARCADVAEGMALADRAQTEAAVSDITRRINTSLRPAKKLNESPLWPDWRAAAAVVALLLSAVVVLYFQFTKVQSGGLATLPTGPEQQEISSTDPPVLRPAEPSSEMVEGETSGEDFLPPASAAKVGPNPAPPRETPARILKDEANEAQEVAVAAKPTIQAAAATPPGKQDGLEKQEDASNKIVFQAPAPVSAQNQVTEALQGQVAGVTVRKARSQQTVAPGSSTHTISGRVVSDTGEGLPGVTVLVKGKGRGVSTDAGGNFSLTLPDPQETLVINYIGYVAQEQPVTAQTREVQVRLEPDHRALNEVVVIGYGAQKRQAAGNSAAAPTGGLPAYAKYLRQQLRYPEAALQEKVQGRVVVGFTVQPDGQLHNLRVLKALNPAADAEALRLVREGPAWQPAQKNGTPIPEDVKVTVRFNR